MNKLRKVLLTFLVVIITITTAFIFNEPVKADENNGFGYCFLCNQDSNGEYYKEVQFINKIKVIKDTFGESIDEIVLAATVLHKYSAEEVIDDQYDENWNPDTYRTSWNDFRNDVDFLGQAQAEKKMQKRIDAKNEQIDLLTAATIVMLNSNGFKAYDEEKYKKALAGNQLVGDESPFGVVFNTAFCGFGEAVDLATTPAQYVDGLMHGESVDSINRRRDTRFKNMKSICENGYIGGVYEGVKDIENKEQKQTAKDSYAQQIIDLANYYKRLRGKGKDACATGNTQVGDYKSMGAKKCGEKFGPLAQAEYSRSGVFASVTLAQAWLESNCGKRTPPNSNNLFGIKCSTGWTGKCSNASTAEYGSGGRYKTTSGFRVYDSVEASITDHSDFLVKNSRYAKHGVFTATNYAEQIKAIHNAGYATDPNYSSTIISIIQANGYDKWDVKTNATSSSDVCSPVGLSGWNIRTIAPTAEDKAFLYENDNRGQCVWYAKSRAVEIVEELGENGKLTADVVKNIKNKLLQSYGNGGDIYDATRNVFEGSSDVKQPKPGSYIVWKESGRPGHIAIIEDVNTSDNTITITEGWSTSGSSCPSSWSCVGFKNRTMDLNDFYKGFGKHYTGNYKFSGYVYFLEPK